MTPGRRSPRRFAAPVVLAEIAALMLRRAFKVAVVAFFGLAVNRVAAGGAFFGIDEIYSNADGSIQFVMLNTVDSGRLRGLTLVASDGSNTHTFTFPSDLPGVAANRIFLVGTQGFADLKVVEPDFVVPNGFLSFPNGSVRLNNNEFRYTGLPSDGVHAFWGSPDFDRIDFGQAIAINFAGQSYTFPAVPRADFEFGGLWWNAPSGSEPGWGIAVEHQGDVGFAAWATYDVDNSPTWFVMLSTPYPAGPFDNGGGEVTFAGTIYRTTGPAYGVAPLGAFAVTESVVGNGGFHFDAAGDSVFYFDIDGKRTNSGTNTYRSITQQTFAGPVPVCRAGAVPGPEPNFQGLWWNAAESGWGLYLTHQGDIVFAIWFTYDAAGKATWLAMAASTTARNAYAGTIYRTRGPAYNAARFDPSKVTETPVGAGMLAFDDNDNGVFTYVADGFGVTQTKQIARQIFATPRVVCNPGRG